MRRHRVVNHSALGPTVPISPSSEHVYIGRGSPFGNPFVIGKDGSRGEVLRRFASYFHAKLDADPSFRAQVDSLYGRVLVCHCKPLGCHGTTIARYLDTLAARYEPQGVAR